MENELLNQLGINWKLFLSQAVNFFILLLVLTFFVYKPLIKVIKERTQKIKTGLEKAEEANVRLKEVDVIGKEKIKQAEQESVNIMKETEKRARALGDVLIENAEAHGKELMENVRKNAAKAQEEANKEVLAKAAELVKKAMIKTVELDPDKIDEELIRKAVAQIKHEA